MSYLVCDKCNKYYELQPGENPEDFDLTCECGGSLHADIKKDRNVKPVQDSLDEDEQFMKERSLGYKLNPNEINFKPLFSIIKIVFLVTGIVISLITLVFSIIFGGLMLMGCYVFYKVLF